MSHFPRWIMGALALGCGAPGAPSTPLAIDVPTPPGARDPAREAAPTHREAPPARVALRIGDEQRPALDRATLEVPRAAFDLTFDLRTSDLARDLVHPVRAAFGSDESMFALRFGATDDSPSAAPFGPNARYADGGESHRPWQVTGTGHHQLAFDPAAPESPLTLIETLDAGRVRVAMRVHSLYEGRRGLHYPLSRYPRERLFVALWFDDDDDGVVERSEVVRLQIRFVGPAAPMRVL